MKPNGRRAWRQAGKRFRHKVRKKGANPPMDVGTYARRHWRGVLSKDGISGGHFPPNGQQEPFTASSLVGMTMGARKRIAGAIAMREAFADYREGKIPEVFPSQIGRYEQQHYRRYRIGERLRPCVGCSWCGTDPGDDLPEDKWTECDGSGVLPARKQNRKERP